MGYYTRYELKVHGLEKANLSIQEAQRIMSKHNNLEKALREIEMRKRKNTIDYIVLVLHEITGYEIFEQIIDDVAYSDDVCWYDHESHMKELSKKFPNLVFELFGAGEEPSDLTKKYFKDGKVQICNAKIIFEPYDEEKLQ